MQAVEEVQLSRKNWRGGRGRGGEGWGGEGKGEGGRGAAFSGKGEPGVIPRKAHTIVSPVSRQGSGLWHPLSARIGRFGSWEDLVLQEQWLLRVPRGTQLCLLPSVCPQSSRSLGESLLLPKRLVPLFLNPWPLCVPRAARGASFLRGFVARKLPSPARSTRFCLTHITCASSTHWHSLWWVLWVELCPQKKR